MSKAYETTMNNLILIQKECRDLQALHEKEKQKREKSKKQIPIKQEITRKEAQTLIQDQIKASQVVTTALAKPGLLALQGVIRRQFRCSGCGVEGHRINRCPNHISS